MKKIILLLITLLLLSSITVFADTEDINITIDGIPIEYTDAKSYISTDNRTMIPLRCMGENMGAEVVWGAEERTITLTKKVETAYLAENLANEYKDVSFQVDMQIGDSLVTYTLKDSNENIISQKNKNMDTVPVLVNDRTFIPARYVAYGLGYDAIWNNESRSVSCTKTNIQDIGFGLTNEISNAQTSKNFVLKILAEMYIYSSECFTPEGYVKLNDYLEYNVKDIEVEQFATTFGFYKSFYENYFPATLMENIENKYISKDGTILDTKSVKELLSICEKDFWVENFIEHPDFVRLPNETDKELLQKFFTEDVIYSIIGE